LRLDRMKPFFRSLFNPSIHPLGHALQDFRSIEASFPHSV